MSRKNNIFKKTEPKENMFEKAFNIIDMQKAEGSDPYEFEGVASTYKNSDAYNDIFLDGSLDEMIGKTVPIMPNHSWDIFKAIGSGTIERSGNQILIKGRFLQGDEDAEKIVTLKKAKVPICLSIGGSIQDSSLVKRNGKYFREISKANIKEVSVVMAGANPKAKITKSEGDDETMPGMNEKLLTISEEQYQKTLKAMENYEKTVKTLEDASKTLEAYKKVLDEAGKKTEPKTDEELEVIKKQYTALEEKFTKQEDEYKKAIETLEKIEKGEMNFGVSVEDKKNIDYRKHLAALEEYIRTGVANEFLKSLNTSNESGAALIPEERVHEILAKVKDYSKLYNDAKVYRTSTNSIKIPVRQDNLNAFQGEKEGGNEGGLKAGKMAYKNLTLEAGKTSAKVEVTQEMLDDSDFDILGEILTVFSQDAGEYVGKKVYYGELGQVDSKGVENQFEGVYQNKDVTDAAILSSLIGNFAPEDIEALPFALNIAHRPGGKFYAGTKAYARIKGFRNQDNGSKLYPFENGVLKVDGYVVEEEPFMDEIAEGKFPVLFCNPKEFYAVIRRKGMYIEKDRNADNDTWAYFARMRTGARVRKPWFGSLLKIRSSSDPAPKATLVSIALSPKNASSTKRETKTFTVMGTYSDGSQAQITAGVKFKSSNVDTATIDENTGVANVLANGNTTITASYLGLNATATLNVTGIA